MIVIVATVESKTKVAVAATRTQNTTAGAALKQQVTKSSQSEAVRRVAANIAAYDPLASSDWESLPSALGVTRHDNHNHLNYILIQRGSGAQFGRQRIKTSVGQIPWAHAYGKQSQ
jgi:hypothetical protein